MNKEILKVAYDLYMKLGVRRVHVADLAMSLGMSPKHLTGTIGSRNSLLEQVVQELLNRIRMGVKRNYLAGNDSLEKLLGVYSFILDSFIRINPAFVYDLEKQHKPLYRKITAYGDHELCEVACRIIDDGKSSGLFRDEVPSEKLYRVHVEKIKYLIAAPEKNISDFTLKTNLLVNDIRGMCTLEGHRELEEKAQDILKKINK